MNKKYIVLVAIIIFLAIIVIGLLMLNGVNQDMFHGSNNANQQNVIQLGSLSLKMPNTYEWAGLNKDGDVAIKNDTNMIYLSKTNSSDIKQEIDHYINYLKNRNLTFTQSDFDVNKIHVEKVTQGGTQHYWFKTKDVVYTIYSWDDNKNMNETVCEIINSI